MYALVKPLVYQVVFGIIPTIIFHFYSYLGDWVFVYISTWKIFFKMVCLLLYEKFDLKVQNLYKRLFSIFKWGI